MESKLKIVIERLKAAKLGENILCSEFWRKIIALSESFNEKDCWSLMIGNIEWLLNTGIMTSDDIVLWFTEKQLNKHGIYSKGTHKIVDGKATGIKKAKFHVSGHSRIVLFDTAFAEGFDSTFITGFQNSSFEIKNCTGESFGNCKVVARDFSKVEAWDNSTVKAETYSFVMAHENAQVQNSENSHTIII
tara:strand:+ start:2708 stop:3277 length:570 start_codon:yes stop_codon:yes gene_type:complete